METRPATPTLAKMVAVRKESQVVGEFLDWLFNTKGYHIANYDDGELYPVGNSIEQWCAEFFDIDLVKVEQERRAMLDYYRPQGQRGQRWDSYPHVGPAAIVDRSESSTACASSSPANGPGMVECANGSTKPAGQ